MNEYEDGEEEDDDDDGDDNDDATGGPGTGCSGLTPWIRRRREDGDGNEDNNDGGEDDVDSAVGIRGDIWFSLSDWPLHSRIGFSCRSRDGGGFRLGVMTRMMIVDVVCGSGG